jgi:hypothetical protein
MDDLQIRDAFKRYGATLHNNRWAVSAIANDGSLVVSCWQGRFNTLNGAMQYVDTLSSWDGKNAPGSNLLREHLTQAIRDSLPVRLVIAHPAPEGSNRIADHFHVRPDLVGRVVSFNGDEFALEFVRQT